MVKYKNIITTFPEAMDPRLYYQQREIKNPKEA